MKSGGYGILWYMKILAIDPGYDRVGVAVIEKHNPPASGERESLLFSACIETNRREDFYARVKQVQSELKIILSEYQPDCMVMEELYFAKNSPTALRVAEARGVISGVAVESNIPVYEIHPNHVKIAITGYGAAKKDDMFFMLSKLIDLGNKKRLDDEIDAISVGIAYLAHEKTMHL